MTFFVCHTLEIYVTKRNDWLIFFCFKGIIIDWNFFVFNRLLPNDGDFSMFCSKGVLFELSFHAYCAKMQSVIQNLITLSLRKCLSFIFTLDMFHLEARTIKPIRGYFAIFIVVAVYKNKKVVSHTSYYLNSLWNSLQSLWASRILQSFSFQ